MAVMRKGGVELTLVMTRAGYGVGFIETFKLGLKEVIRHAVRI